MVLAGIALMCEWHDTTRTSLTDGDFFEVRQPI